MGKSGPNATFNLIFLGLGWPWVGEFVAFIIIFTRFPTQQNLVYCKLPNNTLSSRGQSTMMHQAGHYTFFCGVTISRHINRCTPPGLGRGQAKLQQHNRLQFYRSSFAPFPSLHVTYFVYTLQFHARLIVSASPIFRPNRIPSTRASPSPPSYVLTPDIVLSLSLIHI